MAASHRTRNVSLILFSVVVVTILTLLLARSCAERRREAARDRASTTQVARTSRQVGASSTQAASGSPAGTGGSSDSAGSAGGPANGASSDGQVADPAGQSDSGDQSGDSASPDSENPPPEDSDWVDQVEPPPDDNSGNVVLVDRLVIEDMRVTPYRGAPGQSHAFFAAVRGHAASVSMTISGPGGAFTVNLTSGPEGDVTNWAIDGPGPTMPGTYTYSATAVNAAGRAYTSEGVSEFIIE